VKDEGSVTGFQARVYDATRRIPRGCVTTYGLLASVIGCPCARAVGQALRRNPFAPDVPCHRVIASNLRLGGFRGDTGKAVLRSKENLLRKEGVLFYEGRLLDPSRVFKF